MNLKYVHIAGHSDILRERYLVYESQKGVLKITVQDIPHYFQTCRSLRFLFEDFETRQQHDRALSTSVIQPLLLPILALIKLYNIWIVMSFQN